MRNAIGRTRSGPAPDPNALRNDRPGNQGDWIHLPATGRDGDPPDWPLSRPSARETAHWTRLWKLPQAVAWESGHLHDAVASYVRTLAIAEEKNSRAADRTLARQYQDTLGLTDAGRRSNRWLIDVPAAETVRKDDAQRRTARSRLHSIEGGAA